MKRRIIAMLLCIGMLLGFFPGSVLATDAEQEETNTILAGFSGEGITLDGSISDQGWQMHPIGNTGSFGAQWRKDTLYLAIDPETAATAALTVAGKAIALDGSDADIEIASGNYTEAAIPMSVLGLTKPPMGTRIPISIGADYEAQLELSGIDWFAVENPATALTMRATGKVAFGNDDPTDSQGVEKVSGGYRLYDLYNAAEGAANAAKVRTYGVYQAGAFTALQEHDHPIYVEFDFCAEALPDFGADPRVMSGSSVNKLYPNYGFSMVIADAYDDPANGNYWSTMIRAGICNIGGELNFVAYLNSGKNQYIPMGKQVGDTFRMALSWEMDGSLIVKVDGKQLADIAGVETSLHWYVNECISFNLIRNDSAPASADDNMEVSITNLAAGKHCDPYLIPTVVLDTPIGTAYCNHKITLDGQLSESGWQLSNTVVDDEGTYMGKFGGQWDDSNLYLAVETDSLQAKVELGKTVITVDMTQGTVSGETANGPIPDSAFTVAVNGNTAELSVPIRVLDVVSATAGLLQPIIVRMGEGALQGELVLIKDTPIAWETVVADVTAAAGQPNDYSPKRLSAGKLVTVSNNTDASAVQGAKIYTLQHTYTEGVDTSAKDYAYVRIQKNDTLLAALNESAVDRYVELKLHIEKLPIISNAPTTWSSFACYGLSWDIHGNGKSIVMGVINTASGLQLAVRLPSGSHIIVPLNQQEGSAFRLGIQWHVEDTLDIYVNDTLVTKAPITGATFTDPSAAAIRFNLVRPDNFLTGSANDMTVHICEIALKKEAKVQEEAAPSATPAVVETAYTATGITLDGKVDEKNWLLNNTIGTGKLGAQWDAENLYLALDTAGEMPELTVNGKAVTLSDNNSKTDTVTEVRLSLNDLGITVYDYGTLVPISVKLGDVTVEKTLKLIPAVWFATEQADDPITMNKQGSTGTGVTALQGFAKIDGGYRMYDLWDPAGENPVNVRTYLMKVGTTYNSSGAVTNEGDPDWNPLGEHQSTWLTFDFRADAMPVYAAADMTGLAAYQPCYGLSVMMTDGYNKYETFAGHNITAFGIFNSVDGLMLSVMRNGGVALTVPMGKEVGDNFRISAVWLWDEVKFEDGSGTLIIYIDGAHLVTVEDAQATFGYITRADGVVGFNLMRSKKAAQSTADDLDVSITNIAGGKLDTLSLMDTLSWDLIKGENTDPSNVTSDLTLPTQLTDGILTTDLSWTSDNAVIDASGKVTIPGNLGEPVILTATLAGTGETKTFELIVPGTGEYDGGITVVSRDQNPEDGFGEGLVTHHFTLDENNNSIVLDLGDAQDINLVTLTDSDAFARLRRDNLTLWYYAEAERKFIQIPDFSLKHQGNNWYLYGFRVNTRYIKVHSTHYDGKEADFINALDRMIRAGWDASLEAANAQTVAVPATTLKDQAVLLTLPEGISAEKLRIALDGKPLHHYFDENGNVFVRIPEPNTDGLLTLWNGDADSIELSDKESVYEVTYGVREAWAVTDTHWMQTLSNGTTVGVVVDKSAGYDQYAISYSYDGGMTWSDYHLLDIANEGATETESRYISGVGNFIYDTHTGRLILHGRQSYDHQYETDSAGNKKLTSYKLRTNFIASDDNGLTWYKLGSLESDYDYLVSYTAGLELSCYDGDGPNIDFVFSLATWHPERSDGTMCVVVAYTTDAGSTWQLSDGYIATERSTENASGNNSEGGASEATIMERDDGTLVLYTRYQADNQMHFAVSHSYDHGLTWETGAALGESQVYTSNTQPMFYRYDGAPLLVWGGNNAVDRDSSHTVGNSYIRTPMSVGITYDGGSHFRNIQDLYAGYSLQGLTFMTQHCIINPMVQKGGEDSLLICYWDQFNNRTEEKTMLLRVDNFTDYFYRTKGAYDSFEHGTVRYEGWDVTAGSAVISDEQHFDGSYSMKLLGATAARSVPYLQKGTISMQVYPTGNADLTISLQSAYSTAMDRSAPVNIVIPAQALTPNQWNAIEIRLDLTGEFAVSVTANGNTIAPTLNSALGDYVCFATLFVGGTVYVDEFLVVDEQDAVIYEQTAEGAVMRKIAAIGTVTLDSAERIAAAREAYEALTDEQKPLVTNYADLVAAEAALKALQNALPKISGNLSLNETIDINFIIPAVVDMTDAVPVVKNAATGEDVEYTILPGIGGTTVVRYRARANHMTDEITVQVFDAEGNPLTQMASMSVRKYAGIRFAVAEETEKMMLIRMLDYGALAQINSGVTTDLANGIVTDDLRAFADAYDWADAVALEVPAGSGGVFKAGLALNETIDVTVYTAATNVADGDKFVVKCNGEELTEDQYIVRLLDDGRYVIRYSVKSNEMSDEIYIAIVGEDNTVKAETTLGVRIYAQKFLAAVPTGNQAAMLLAMLDYGALAQIYAGNTENLANCFVSDTLRQVLISYPWPAN